MQLRGLGRRSLVAVAILVALGVAAPSAQDRPQGLTTPILLPAYDREAPGCAAPTGLARTLTFSQDNDRAFMQGVGAGLKQAAEDRGLGYVNLVAGSSAETQSRQVREAVAAHTGGLIAAPVDAVGLAADLQEAIWSGAYVGTVVPPPATTILNAPQYLTGKTLGDAAAAYIQATLGGKADVVLLTHDSLQFLAPRFAAMRDALQNLPDVSIVADISPVTVDENGGYEMMKTILEAYPNVDVVLGADTVVLGALRALREAGKARPDQFLGGIDGEPEAVSEIRTGAGPYKASVALSSPIFGYALGSLAADWLEGKSVPQAMDILPFALTQENLVAYELDQADPAAVYADPVRRDAYLRMYGNICFETRDQYLNFPWSSESH